MTTVVEVQRVSKLFVIRKDKSLKERIVNFGRSRAFREQFRALDDVTLDIESGTTVGLIGPNGSGKSTLLKLIGGILQPDTGSVRLRGRLAALLELGAGFHPDLTGRENIYLNAAILGLSRAETERHLDAIIEFSGIEPFIDTQVKFYSSGMYVRLAFAVAVHVDPDILLVDEVLAVGDEPFQRKCLDQIRRFQREGRTIVLVTHSLDQVAEFCDRAVVLESGKVVADGKALDSLRALRADFEEARQEEQERVRLSAEPGARLPRARFTGIAVAGERGAVDEHGRAILQPGEGLHVAFELESDDPVADCVLEFGISNPLGAPAMSTSTTMLGRALPPLGSVNRYRTFLPGLHLNPGDYVVRAGLKLKDGIELHMVPEAAMFTVNGTTRTKGFVPSDPTFEVLEAQVVTPNL